MLSISKKGCLSATNYSDGNQIFGCLSATKIDLRIKLVSGNQNWFAGTRKRITKPDGNMLAAEYSALALSVGNPLTGTRKSILVPGNQLNP